MKFNTVALAALVGLTSTVVADNFANFFDDSACSKNGGIGVDITNDGCLSEAGRGSVYIPRAISPGTQMCLVKTRKDGSCLCQSEGYNFNPTGFYAVLDPEDKVLQVHRGQ